MNNSIFYANGGRQYAYFPVKNNDLLKLKVSLRKAKRVVLINGTGSKIIWTNPTTVGQTTTPLPLMVDYTTATDTESSGFVNITNSPPFTGNLKMFIGTGLKDVYSLRIEYGDSYSGNPNTVNTYSGLFPDFISQFSNLFSLDFDIYGGAGGSLNSNRTLNGDLGAIPNSLKRYRINQLGVFSDGLFLNLTSFDGKDFFWFDRTEVGTTWTYNRLRVTGDIAKIPNTVTWFRLVGVKSTSTMTYTAGKVWQPLLQRFEIKRSPNDGTYRLSSTICNNIFIDIDNSGTMPTGSSPTISLSGTRTSASDNAVANLQAKGFTVSLTT